MSRSPKPPLKKKTDSAARSPCPVAFALDILGDRWTLLVIRDLFLGSTRFREFISSPERIPTNILTDRLARLVRHELVEKVPARDGTKRLGYVLTPKGEALGPLLTAMRDWGLCWGEGTQVLKKALKPGHIS
jgi:DNA-binding HxlR family transcriptional regulator